MRSFNTRRAILQALAAAGAVSVFPRSAVSMSRLAPADCAGAGAGASAALAAALCAERWIARSRIPTSFGVTWAVTPDESGASAAGLYSGAAGIVLFYMELYAATSDARFLREALAGADEIAARQADAVPVPDRRGLYTGFAGHVFMFAELGKLPHADRYRALAGEYVGRLRDMARPAGAGVDWNDYSDVVYGNAGIGLALLYAHATLGAEAALPLARQAGLRLIEIGIPADGGLRWEMQPGFPRYMPNFSHGTSGNGYFLAALHEATGEQRFLDAALLAGRHVLAVADKDSGLCNVMHDDPEGRNLYYLGWCHGPAGTARLFYRLARVTGDATWDEWVRRSAKTAIASGVPEKRTSGFWNNYGACCGDAAIAQFYLDLFGVYGEEQYLQFARRMLESVYRHVSRGAEGCKWIHADMRREPENVKAQTGFMQGAAGIGTVLLRMDGQERGRKHIVFPDSPFPAAPKGTVMTTAHRCWWCGPDYS